MKGEIKFIKISGAKQVPLFSPNTSLPMSSSSNSNRTAINSSSQNISSSSSSNEIEWKTRLSGMRRRVEGDREKFNKLAEDKSHPDLLVQALEQEIKKIEAAKEYYEKAFKNPENASFKALIEEIITSINEQVKYCKNNMPTKEKSSASTPS